MFAYSHKHELTIVAVSISEKFTLLTDGITLSILRILNFISKKKGGAN